MNIDTGTNQSGASQSVLIGTSGFSYPHWGKGVFYPEHLKSNHWLTYYSDQFATVELNHTFYRLPSEEMIHRWCESTRSNFVFAVKGSRFITHLKQLQQPQATTNAFLEKVALFKQQLGPILFQLPPSLAMSWERLNNFLDVLKTQTVIPNLKVALEVRHPSWLVSQIFNLLESANVALCLADGCESPVQGPLTASFVYVRRHGPTSRYNSSYTRKMLQADAHCIQGWLQDGRDVYVYFNNDAQGYAAQNAQQLQALMNGTPSPSLSPP